MERLKPLIKYQLILLVVLCIFLQSTPVVFAQDVDYDTTDVLEDLLSSPDFNILDYPYSLISKPKIITFTEYCYSYIQNMRSNYGLYLYLYNPSGEEISHSLSNKIQMSISSTYIKYTLKFCSKSDSNLFYKFKILDTPFADQVNPDQRDYHISGIELLYYGNTNATEYLIGGTYSFTGYAEGYGPSPLTCSVTTLETLSLNVHHTYYRTNVSQYGANHYNEVNTVYFSIPNYILSNYGYLQKIRAEWWEYKTKMAAITSNQDFYNQLVSNVYTPANSSIPYFMWVGFKGTPSMGFGSPVINSYDWTFNKDLSPKYTIFGSVCEISQSSHISTLMPYAFYSPTLNVDSVFSFLYSSPPAGKVNSTQVSDWIYSYNSSDYIDCNGRHISKALFEDTVDTNRTLGHNDTTIDLSNTFDLLSYDFNHSWWNKLWDYGFSWPETSGDYYNVQPIYKLDSSDFQGSIASSLLINPSDVSSLQTFCSLETLKDNSVFLFRFATTDYYSAPCARTGVSESSADTYIAQQTVFLDFDIIELTFTKDDVYTTIPAVSSPIDIINDFTPPKTNIVWWKILLLLLPLLLIFPLLKLFHKEGNK